MTSLKVSCIECKKIFEAKSISHHLRVAHNQYVPVYSCSDSMCCRIYNSFNSLRNHHKRCHNNTDTRSVQLNSNDDNSNYEVSSHCMNTAFDPPSQPTYYSYNNIIEKLIIPEVKIKKSFFSNNALITATELYGDLSLNRSQSENIIKIIHDNILNSQEFNSLKSSVSNIVPSSSLHDILMKFNGIQSCFSEIKTEHLFTKQLRKLNYFIDPKPVVYGYRDELRSGVLEQIKCEGFIIPLEKYLKNYFEMKNVFSSILNYMTKIEIKNNIENIIQTNFWKSKITNHSVLTLPVFIYEDAFETGNPLGSHAGIQSMSAMYLSVPCLPPEFRSQLSNIFLVQIAYSSDVKKFGSKVVYNNIIEQLNSLSSKGIDLEISGIKLKIYLQLSLIIGDNLGLNTMLGFTSSFNSDYFCRFCKITKKKSSQECDVQNCLLRNKINYEADVKKNNVSETGIKEECSWNDVNGFHVTENYCVDIMHDIFEGVCNYDMGHILHELINIQKLFSLDDLNFKITYFPYPDNINKPPVITANQLTNKYIKMSAAEMKNFILYAALIIADLLPNKNLDHWKLYLLLRSIVCIVLKSEICDNDTINLDKLIKKHHILYVKLFGPTLKPKHHFMLHYPAIMKVVGPLVHIWAMRFEAKHQPMKQSAVSSMNTTNLPKTIAIKQQFCSAKVFLKNNCCTNSISYENLDENFVSQPFNIVGMNYNNYDEIKSVVIRHITYSVSTIVQLNNDDLPSYGFIHNIFREKVHETEEHNFAFICKIIEAIGKVENLQSFEVQNTDKYEFFQFENLFSHTPCIMVKLLNNKLNIPCD
ncbi:uncharacterized protein LOC123261257 [Cotesia glomerata]|uniref:uncharacterized protein LOC123261257 n=1 Tax=Cotesia glomerata TaxID=32391 RepID=UPI001D02B873|nr:uncharacterized protein LOC123261257 [Cotesia glomerata]